MLEYIKNSRRSQEILKNILPTLLIFSLIYLMRDIVWLPGDIISNIGANVNNIYMWSALATVWFTDLVSEYIFDSNSDKIVLINYALILTLFSEIKFSVLIEYIIKLI